MVRDRPRPGRQRLAVPIAIRRRRVQAGLQACPRGAADGLAGERVIELDALGRQMVKIRRDIELLPIAPHRVPALLVREIEYDVWTERRHRFSPPPLSIATLHGYCVRTLAIC